MESDEECICLECCKMLLCKENLANEVFEYFSNNLTEFGSWSMDWKRGVCERVHSWSCCVLVCSDAWPSRKPLSQTVEPLQCGSIYLGFAGASWILTMFIKHNWIFTLVIRMNELHIPGVCSTDVCHPFNYKAIRKTYIHRSTGCESIYVSIHVKHAVMWTTPRLKGIGPSKVGASSTHFVLPNSQPP